MADSSWPRGTGTAAGRAPAPARWERPNPARLNDTAAIQRKGTHPYELLLCGEETVASGGRWTSPLETAWNPEHAFGGSGLNAKNGNGNAPQVGMSPPQGCGAVVAIHTPQRSAPGATPNGVGRSSPAPDKNRTAPGNGNSLRAAVDCIPKSC